MTICQISTKSSSASCRSTWSASRASAHRCPATSLSAFPISSSLPRRDLETRRSMSPPLAIMRSQWFTRGIVGPDDRIYLGADLGLRPTYRDGEQLRPIRRLAANSRHGSPWKDPGRSGTWADWITGRAGRERFWNESDCLEPKHDARGRQSRGRNPGFQGPAVRAGRYPDDPFGVEQPYARPARGRGAGENEANGPVDQCVARADRRRASFDQRVEEQANRRRGNRRIRH